jgi:hypothetical protein
MSNIINESAIETRNFWIQELQKLSGDFVGDSDKLERELNQEVNLKGVQSIINHIRLCGNIPESYGHDTSEEKLYSKYTDNLLSIAYNHIGLSSVVLRERADAADVEVVSPNYGFVADAKAFRLSRTAKNQKDFKVQAMDTWKRGKPYAMVVCPIYQLPNTSSQIYQQATTRNVCIFTYSHLSLLLRFSDVENKGNAMDLLHAIFKTIEILNPSKNAIDYWTAVNRTMLDYSMKIPELWKMEKLASIESISIGKDEALTFLSQEREKFLRMSHQDAIKELLKVHKIESKIQTIKSISDNGLISVK